MKKDKKVQYIDKHGNKNPIKPIRPPHKRTSLVKLDFNDEVMQKLYNTYRENVHYVTDVFETCPPEIKLSLALAFEIPINTDEYPEHTEKIRFPSPFMTDENIKLLTDNLDCNRADIAMNIYNACPPEQVVMAIAIAKLKEKGNTNIQ